MSFIRGRATAPQHFALRIAIFFSGYFLVNGVAQPFFPVWLEARGLSNVEIANCIAIPALVRVFLTPFAGIYADRAPNRRFAVISLTLPAVFVFLLAWPARSFWPLLSMTGIAFTLSALASPPALALALTGVRRFGLDFGRMRMVGSIAFALANVGAGAVLGLLDAEATFWLILLAMVLSAAVSFALPVTPPAERAADDVATPDTRPSREVLGNHAFLALMAACSLGQASHAMLNGFGSIEWHKLGFSSLQIGSFFAIGLVFEIAFLMWSKIALRHIGAHGVLLLGAIGGIVRWSLFPLHPGYLGYAFIQSLHGLTFGANALGTQQLIAQVVPERMTASAQGIYAMFVGILIAAATSLAGPIYGAFGINGFFFMVPISATSLVILLAFRRFATAQSRP